jgi:hypothetical protein
MYASTVARASDGDVSKTGGIRGRERDAREPRPDDDDVATGGRSPATDPESAVPSAQASSAGSAARREAGQQSGICSLARLVLGWLTSS